MIREAVQEIETKIRKYAPKTRIGRMLEQEMATTPILNEGFYEEDNGKRHLARPGDEFEIYRHLDKGNILRRKWKRDVARVGLKNGLVAASMTPIVFSTGAGLLCTVYVPAALFFLSAGVLGGAPIYLPTISGGIINTKKKYFPRRIQRFSKLTRIRVKKEQLTQQALEEAT